MPHVFLIQGASGSGKTMLLENLIQLAIQKGQKTGIIKSCGHQISIEQGIKKDSDRFQAAGAQRVMLQQAQQYVLFDTEGLRPLSELVLQFFAEFDIVLIEGFADSIEFPRLIVLNSSIPPRPIVSPHHLLGFAGEQQMPSPIEDLPVFDIHDPASIYSFLMDHAAPCSLSYVKINGKTIPMNHFVENMISSTIKGLLDPIKKEDGTIEQVEIKLCWPAERKPLP